MAYDPERITYFGKTDARGQHVPFGIKAKDRTRHVYVIGKTGMGKSTLLENMAIQDIENGEGLAFIDPHGQTAEKLLDYIPRRRAEDVLYFAPFDMEYPISFNVMEDVGADRRHLVVSGLMSVFEKIWVDAWSARMAYILQNTLLALLEYPDSTLLGVNQMLSNAAYREKVVANISDPAVKSFWVDEFANYNERYMQEAGDAIKNKIGQFTSNPLIRNIIGQPHSSFNLRQIMDEQKIIIMNLSKGLVGESNANLLGSMLTTRIYLAAMSRADLPIEELNQKPNFYFYVDEFQSFANATFANILSESRKYKLNLTIAHQYIEQMEEEVKNAVFGNVGTVIAFRVGPFDAEVLETVFAPRFVASDICNLGFAQIYLSLMIDGIGSAPFSALTLPPIEPPEMNYKALVLHCSRKQFASARADVEASITNWHKEREQETSEAREKKRKGKSGGEKNHTARQQEGNGGARQSPPSHPHGKPAAKHAADGAPHPRANGAGAPAPTEAQQGAASAAQNDHRSELQAALARITETNRATKAAAATRASAKLNRDAAKSGKPRAHRNGESPRGKKEQRNGNGAAAHGAAADTNTHTSLREALAEVTANHAPQHSPTPDDAAPQGEASSKRAPAAPAAAGDTPAAAAPEPASPPKDIDNEQLARMLRLTTGDQSPFK